MIDHISPHEIFGFVRPAVDAHTLGVSYVAKLLSDCGYRVTIGNRRIAEALNNITNLDNWAVLNEWITTAHITRLGFSHRLDPLQAQEMFGRVYSQLRYHRVLASEGGPLKGVYFAGLPLACQRIECEYSGAVPVFCGDETPYESLIKLGVPSSRIPHDLRAQSVYDEMRLSFARSYVAKEQYHAIEPVDRSDYHEYGTARDHVVKRLEHGRLRNLPPLMRVHVGPYFASRTESIALFHEWIRQLREAGLLDILSIGTSQLTQSNFGEDWGERPNGGGVPIATASEYRLIYEAAKPMLVRTYAGTKNVPQLARIHEEALNIAWHALSFWWFCQTDGRGPNPVYQNLNEHLDTLDFIARTDKPFEPNIPHHFSFRGGDDVTYILSAYLAARVAKSRGVRWLILQAMFNTPKYTLGIQDLAKVRAMLKLVRTLENDSFRVILQPRAGLDYFSPDLDKARVQLAAVTAMMDDIEPGNEQSPPIIHVVSYSEASHLADPQVINESIKIVRGALGTYRTQRLRGKIPNIDDTKLEVAWRTEELYRETLDVVNVILKTVPDPFSPSGLYRIFAAGFLPTPYLWECRDEFAAATNWRTEIVNGGVKVVDRIGSPIPPLVRAVQAAARLSALKLPILVP